MNNPNITIGKPTLKDVDTLWRWGEENWELWGDATYKWFTKKMLRLWIKDQRDDVFLVARAGDVLIGMCVTHVIRDWAFCFGLYVVPEYRKQGIASRMFQETDTRLKAIGVGSLSLLVDVKNERATEFYEHSGFMKGYKFYLMTKAVK